MSYNFWLKIYSLNSKISDENKILEFRKLLYGVKFCGMRYIEETCGELRLRWVSE